MSDFLSLKQDIISRAGVDAQFRSELKANPKSAIEKHFPDPDGKKIPSNMTIVVCEDSENEVYLNVVPTDHHAEAW